MHTTPSTPSPEAPLVTHRIDWGRTLDELVARDHHEQPVTLHYLDPNGGLPVAQGDLPIDLSWYLPGPAEEPTLAWPALQQHIQQLRDAGELPALPGDHRHLHVLATHPDTDPLLVPATR